MPRLAAEHAFRTAKLQPFEYWSPGLAGMVCRNNGIRLIFDDKVRRKLGLDFPGLDDHEWDAKAFEMPSGRQVIVSRALPHHGRMVWSIIHELGHILLGHQGALFNLRTLDLTEGERWHEAEADLFARQLLLPTDEMIEFRRQRLNPRQIAERKGLSIAAVNVRLKTMQRDGRFDDIATEAG
jgi:hypothetical protein